MMNDVYEKFLKSSEEFIFAENKPEKSDIIFVPGNGYPQMAEKAAELFAQDEFAEAMNKYSVGKKKRKTLEQRENIFPLRYK